MSNRLTAHIAESGADGLLAGFDEGMAQISLFCAPTIIGSHRRRMVSGLSWLFVLSPWLDVGEFNYLRI